MKIKMAAAGAAAGLLATAYVGDAHATWYRTHGAACMAMDAGFSNPLQFVADYAYAVGNELNGNQELMCAPPDTSTVTRTAGSTTLMGRVAFQTINVEYYSETGGTFTAALCEDDWNGDSGTCSNFATQGGTGHQTIFLGGEIGVNGAWTHSANVGYSNNFGYVYVLMPPESSSGMNTIRGIYYST